MAELVIAQLESLRNSSNIEDVELATLQLLYDQVKG